MQMKKQKFTVGIDIGGTNTVFGFVDDEGKFLSGNSIPTETDIDPGKFVSKLAASIKKMKSNYESDFLLEGIGVAAPSANYFKGTIEAPSNLNWGNVNIVSILKEHFDLPIAIINDASAAALGEFYHGHAKGIKNFIVITLGTGVGAGVFVDGNLIYGERGLAGELGHIIINHDGRKCNCGRCGCLETYVSATGMRRTVLEFLSFYNDRSELREFTVNQLTGQLISELAGKGDPIAVRAFDFTGQILGRAMANLAAYFSPRLIVLFGGLVNSGNLLLEPTKRYFEENLLNVHKGRIQVLISKLNNGSGAVLGASSIIKRELLQKSSVNFSHNKVL